MGPGLPSPHWLHRRSAGFASCVSEDTVSGQFLSLPLPLAWSVTRPSQIPVSERGGWWTYVGRLPAASVDPGLGVRRGGWEENSSLILK